MSGSLDFGVEERTDGQNGLRREALSVEARAAPLRFRGAEEVPAEARRGVEGFDQVGGFCFFNVRMA